MPENLGDIRRNIFRFMMLIGLILIKLSSNSQVGSDIGLNVDALQKLNRNGFSVGCRVIELRIICNV